jgi:predicted protein tyrosine phosphatase
MLEVRPYPQAEIEGGTVRGAGLISIRSPGESVAYAPNLFDSRVLELVFDDVPVATFVKADGQRFAGATRADIERALAFARRVAAEQADGHLAVHCAFGRSRSSAIAVAILADLLGQGREMEAVDRLLRFDRPHPLSSGGFTGLLGPNPGIIRMVDDMLGCKLRLEAALLLKSPGYNTWKGVWTRQGVWPAAEEAEREARLEAVKRQLAEG